MNSKFGAVSPQDNMKLNVFNGQRILHYCVSAWLVVALFGQWLFAMYILVVFGTPLITGTVSESSFSHIIKGYVNGDSFGNLMMFAHIIPAAVLSVCGTLQIIPYLRRNHPKFHRFNGRIFLTIGLLGAFTGLYLTWLRDTRLSDIGSAGITLNGILIPIAVYFAWKYARLRRFDIHQRWAIHAFLLINGVWMFRLLLMVWFLLNQGPNGNSNKLDGPMDIFFSFACYGLPMLIAELIMWAKRQGNPNSKKVLLTLAVTVFGLLITASGVFAAAMMMWSPIIMEVLF
jgi:hypothetical protein